MLNSNLFFQGIFLLVGRMWCTVKDTPKTSTLIGKSFLLRKNRLEMSLTLHILAEYKTHVYYTFWAREGRTTTGSWSTKPRSAKNYHLWTDHLTPLRETTTQKWPHGDYFKRWNFTRSHPFSTSSSKNRRLRIFRIKKTHNKPIRNHKILRGAQVLSSI